MIINIPNNRLRMAVDDYEQAVVELRMAKKEAFPPGSVMLYNGHTKVLVKDDDSGPLDLVSLLFENGNVWCKSFREVAPYDGPVPQWILDLSKPKVKPLMSIEQAKKAVDYTRLSDIDLCDISQELPTCEDHHYFEGLLQGTWQCMLIEELENLIAKKGIADPEWIDAQLSDIKTLTAECVDDIEEFENEIACSGANLADKLLAARGVKRCPLCKGLNGTCDCLGE